MEMSLESVKLKCIFFTLIPSVSVRSTCYATTPAKKALQNVDVILISCTEETLKPHDDKKTPQQVNRKSP